MHLNPWINVVIVTHIRTLSLASPPGCPIRWIRQNMTLHPGMYLCIICAWLLDQHLCKLMKMLLVISSVFEMYRATSNLTFIWTMYCRHFEELRCFILVSYLLCESCEQNLCQAQGLRFCQLIKELLPPAFLCTSSGQEQALATPA